MHSTRIFHRIRNGAKYLKINRSSLHFSVLRIFTPGINSVVKNTVSNISLTSKINFTETLDNATFETVCDETLQSLTEYFEEIVEEADNLSSGDVSYSSGVLTVNLGSTYGTYVINRQIPNRQIWLSSPVSGPKRYDFVGKDNIWIYKHDGETLHRLLQREISEIVEVKVDFSCCLYGKL